VSRGFVSDSWAFLLTYKPYHARDYVFGVWGLLEPSPVVRCDQCRQRPVKWGIYIMCNTVHLACNLRIYRNCWPTCRYFFEKCHFSKCHFLVTKTGPFDIKPSRCFAHGLCACVCVQHFAIVRHGVSEEIHVCPRQNKQTLIYSVDT